MPTTTQLPSLAQSAGHDLRRLNDAELCTRLLAISLTAERPVAAVAASLNVSPRSVFRWLEAYRQHGVAGLKARPRGHRRPKLNDLHKQRIARWLREGVDEQGRPTVWTLERLRVALRKECGVEISIMPLWLHLRKMGIQLRHARRAR